ncbi:GMC oxidoreductase [Flavilitoribacter nigricans]|uniref:Cholesterol oxidase n=1 Tax=Flavilitoribacter nigricans (strain ATCC 23147 / DSM 23189 / NBRC 102662 / NCIMB 1420 / SS-2) TaxID=1122177 RepID=A0A2D0N1F5_FLAN2|nr:GMC oxidoreductase [Flavilitoribacter nigricans]PHN02361.1 hypothetical protein CRP01_32470 [Flavilitoribacter nigricans DSM 23189 = NBRC 102662]
MKKDTDVLIIGSGFGASVAALRFAEAGKSVTVLERGGYITREKFEADDDMLWQPDNGRYGMNDFQKRGTHVIPWLGAGVGGGSHVYAGTLKRREFFDDFPSDVSVAEMTPFYELAEDMMQAVKYPDHPPYDQLPAYRIFREAEKEMEEQYPDQVEEHGDILLGISYAPNEALAGKVFTNKYGAQQRYSDPDEQKILGGDIEVKNTLDKNYLHLATERGAVIKEFAQVVKIEPLPEGGYRVFWKDPRQDSQAGGQMTTETLVCGAGSIGSTELLLQNKYQHRTLPDLSDQLGKRYFTNGDYIMFLLPRKGLLASWIGLFAAIAGWIAGWGWLALVGVIAYFFGWYRSDPKAAPDQGSTNSDYIRFRHRDGSPQGMYIEGGRYPTPVKALLAIGLSLAGEYRPHTYGHISNSVNFLGKYVPVFELIERSWPIPMLMMGRDDAVGQFHLNEENEAEIEFPIENNDQYVDFLTKWGKIFSKKADSYFLPNFVAKAFRIVEIPHNMGGCSMGENAKSGVVDSYGRVFGYDNFLILDGSIMPCSLGPNPALTILAFAERSMRQVISQPEKAEDGIADRP